LHLIILTLFFRKSCLSLKKLFFMILYVVLKSISHVHGAFVVRTLLDGKAVIGDVKFSEQLAIKNYISCDYLALDDLGVEKPTEYAKKTLN
jgi:hypothetical protein